MKQGRKRQERGGDVSSAREDRAEDKDRPLPVSYVHT
jgi:hypothetical protein